MRGYREILQGTGGRGEALIAPIRRDSRRCKIYSPLQNVKFFTIYKNSTNPSRGGQSPLRGLWGFAPVSASPLPMQNHPLPCPYLFSPPSLPPRSKSADPARAKPGRPRSATATPDPQAGRAVRLLRRRTRASPSSPCAPPHQRYTPRAAKPRVRLRLTFCRASATEQPPTPWAPRGFAPIFP